MRRADCRESYSCPEHPGTDPKGMTWSSSLNWPGRHMGLPQANRTRQANIPVEHTSSLRLSWYDAGTSSQQKQPSAPP